MLLMKILLLFDILLYWILILREEICIDFVLLICMRNVIGKNFMKNLNMILLIRYIVIIVESCFYYNVRNVFNNFDNLINLYFVVLMICL